MIKQSIVILPLIHDWNWTADTPNQTAGLLKKFQNTVVTYELHKQDINFRRLILNRIPIITYKSGIYFFRPFHPIPFERLTIIYELNKKLSVYILLLWIKIKFGFHKKIILWLFHPREVWLIDELKHLLSNSFVSVFDCIDYFAKGSTHEKKLLTRLERKLVKEADVVTAVSKNLQRYLRQIRPDVAFVSQGFRIRDFQSPNKQGFKFSTSSPIVGYVGGLNDRLDFSLLTSLIKNNPQWKFVFWGPVQTILYKLRPQVKEKISTLLSLPNVIHGKSKNKKEIPFIISQFDVCIIPYDASQEFNKYSYPLKTFEYFFMGKPVVSTSIKELKFFPKYVKIGETASQWENTIKKLLSTPWPSALKSEQKIIAENNSWENKIDKISTLIEARPKWH